MKKKCFSFVTVGSVVLNTKALSPGVFVGSDSSNLPSDVWHSCDWDDHTGIP